MRLRLLDGIALGALGVLTGGLRQLVRRVRYRHFKGGEYDLVSIAQHTETDELLVIYRSVKEPDRLWVRPLAMFVEQVERPEGTFPRFQRTA